MHLKRRIELNYLNPNSHFIPDPVITIQLQAAVEEYLFWKKSYAPTAGVRYEDRLKPFTEYVGKTTPISKIQTRDIILFHKKMKDEGYSLKTIEYSCTILKNFFMFWLGRGVCSLNPLEIRSMRSVSPDKDLISQEDFDLMSESLDERFFPELVRKLALHMLWDCGMRLSELCDLNISDIEETERPGIRCAKIQRRKSYRYNIIVWGTETNRLLNLYLGLRLCLDSATDALFVASPKQRTRISNRTIQRWIKEITEMAAIDKNFSPHCFRHSKAHRVLDKSGNVRDVQSILGHSNPMSSFAYLGLNKTNQVVVSEKYLQKATQSILPEAEPHSSNRQVFKGVL